MIYYASRTGTRRNLEAMRSAGFRLLVSRAGVWRTEGMAYCLDSGAWFDYLACRSFDEEAYERLIDKLGAGADFIVLPDIVAGGLPSLELSVRWSNRALATGAPLVLIAVQDGMEDHDLAPLVGPRVGIFLGGSTEWKLDTAMAWGRFAAARDIHYHFARINTVKRIFLAHAAGATTGDGSSASRFAKTVPLLAGALAHQDMLSPRRAA